MENYLPNVIGGDGVAGHRPGLLRVVGPIPAPVDPVTDPDPNKNIKRVGTATKPQFEVAAPPGATGPAFTLAARADDTALQPPPALTTWTVTVTDMQADGTFTLTARWSKTVTIAPTEVDLLKDALAFGVKIVPPPDGFKTPAFGSTTLSGGADAAGPIKSSATLPANA